MFGYDSDSSGPPNETHDADDERTIEVEITHHSSQYFNTDITIETSKVKGIAHQLWPAAYLLCNYLEVYHRIYFNSPSTTSVVELGAGVGLGGILAGMFGCRTVIITDLAEAMPLIQKNIDHNQSLFPNPSSVRAAVLRWGESVDHQSRAAELQLSEPNASVLVIAADCVYWEHLYEPFYQTLLYFVCELGATVVLSHVKRWKKEKKFFTMVGRKMSLEVVYEAVEMVPDDDPHCKFSQRSAEAESGGSIAGTTESQIETSAEGFSVDVDKSRIRMRRQVSRVYRLTKKAGQE